MAWFLVSLEGTKSNCLFGDKAIILFHPV
jgi:hypothetical protein